jgi:glycosyltransferase involved in cell wall biosynthesis
MMMKKEPVRVLQLNIGQVFGGVSSMLLNIYREIDHQVIQFDFLAPRKSSFAMYRQEIESSGGKIIELNTKGFFLKRKIEFWRKLYQLIKKEDYQIIHCNSGSIFFNLQVAAISKLSGAKKIIIHSHNAGNDKKWKIWMGNLVKWLFPYTATDYFACARKAGSFMFTKKTIDSSHYRIINNGVDTEKFRFNASDRQKIRAELQLSKDQKTLLHVGRFVHQKNHQQLIKIFAGFLKKEPKAVLLLVGEGELEPEIKKQVNALGIMEHVRFLGVRKDIPQLMSASDLFLLPSHYEGLPVVGVEAQANGLPCCFSSVITQEIDLINGMNRFVDLTSTETEWSEALNHVLTAKKSARERYAEKIAEKGFSLTHVADELTQFYISED